MSPPSTPNHCEPFREILPSQRWTLWILLALGAVVVFWPASGGALLRWDDNVNIYENPHLQRLDWRSVWWMFTDFEYVRRYMPLAWLGWGVQHQWFGLSPWVHHVGNILLHALNTVLVCLVIEQLLTLGSRGVRKSPKSILWASAAGAILWAVHPLRVETVAWASARIYLQAAFLLFVSVALYLEYARRRRDQLPGRSYYWGSVAAYAGSLLTYPIGMTALGVLIILDVYPLGRRDSSKAGWRAWLGGGWFREKIPFLGVSAFVVAVTLWARLDAGIYTKPPTLVEFGWFARLMQAAYVGFYYVWRPWWLADHSPVYPTLISFNPAALPFWLSMAGLAGVSVAAWLWRKRWPALLAIWAAQLVLLIPFLGLTEHPHFASDRYSYAVGIAWALVAALGVWKLLEAWPGLKGGITAGTVTAVLALILVASSIQEMGPWRNTATLLEHMIGQLGNHPYRARLLLSLGVHHQEGGHEDLARACYEEILRIDPNHANAHANLADILAERKEYDEARKHYEAALRLVPSHASALPNFGVCLAQQGQVEEALKHFLTFLNYYPGNPQAHYNLSIAFHQLGRVEEARKHRQEAQRLEQASLKRSR